MQKISVNFKIQNIVIWFWEELVEMLKHLRILRFYCVIIWLFTERYLTLMC